MGIHSSKQISDNFLFTWINVADASDKYIYLFGFYDFCSLHIDQLAHCVLYGVELTTITCCVKTICICLNKDKDDKNSMKSEAQSEICTGKKKNHLAAEGNLSSYLRAELNQNHVLVWSWVSYDLHMLHDVIKRCQELHEVVAGHGGGDSQDANHSAASHIFSQWCHFAATRQKTRSRRWNRRALEAAKKRGGWDSLGLVQMHDAMDDLHRGVAAEERDVVRQLLGGGVRSSARGLAAVLRTFDALWSVWFSLCAPLLCWSTGVSTSSLI